MTNVLTKQGDKAPNCQGLAWCSNIPDTQFTTTIKI
jgi:hypothetical protein